MAPQCHNFDSTAGAGGFTAGAAAPAVNMLEEALFQSGYRRANRCAKAGNIRVMSGDGEGKKEREKFMLHNSTKNIFTLRGPYPRAHCVVTAALATLVPERSCEMD